MLILLFNLIKYIFSRIIHEKYGFYTRERANANVYGVKEAKQLLRTRLVFCRKCHLTHSLSNSRRESIIEYTYDACDNWFFVLCSIITSHPLVEHCRHFPPNYLDDINRMSISNRKFYFITLWHHIFLIVSKTLWDSKSIGKKKIQNGYKKTVFFRKHCIV